MSQISPKTTPITIETSQTWSENKSIANEDELP
jgi:hypothetical protein